MSDLKTYYKELPPWGRGVVGVGATLIAIIVAVKAYQFIKSKVDTADANREVNSATDDLKTLMGNGTNPSFPNSQYEAWSNQLVQAFSGCGTDTGTILNVFQSLSNEADLLKLISTYGIRKYDKCLSWAYPFGGSSNNLSLSAALADELGQSDLDKVNTILLNKGMNYRF